MEIDDVGIEKGVPFQLHREQPRKGRMEGYALARSYQKNGSEGESNEVRDALEAYVREGARRMLAVALEEEVNAFLGRQRYERARAFRGYRNGYHLPREVTVGLGPVEVRLPRVAKVPPDVTPQRFESQLVMPYPHSVSYTHLTLPTKA